MKDYYIDDIAVSESIYQRYLDYLEVDIPEHSAKKLIMEELDLLKKKKNDTIKTDTTFVKEKGYKVLNANMLAPNGSFLYRMGENVLINPEERPLIRKDFGLHFCTELKMVENFCDINEDSRIFEAEGLVDPKQYEKERAYYDKFNDISTYYFHANLLNENKYLRVTDKLTLTRELTDDEVFDTFFSDKDKDIFIKCRHRDRKKYPSPTDFMKKIKKEKISNLLAPFYPAAMIDFLLRTINLDSALIQYAIGLGNMNMTDYERMKILNSILMKKNIF